MINLTVVFRQWGVGRAPPTTNRTVDFADRVRLFYQTDADDAPESERRHRLSDPPDDPGPAAANSLAANLDHRLCASQALSRTEMSIGRVRSRRSPTLRMVKAGGARCLTDSLITVHCFVESFEEGGNPQNRSRQRRGTDAPQWTRVERVNAVAAGGTRGSSPKQSVHRVLLDTDPLGGEDDISNTRFHGRDFATCSQRRSPPTLIS